jgi:hypothetical protein
MNLAQLQRADFRVTLNLLGNRNECDRSKNIAFIE